MSRGLLFGVAALAGICGPYPAVSQIYVLVNEDGRSAMASGTRDPDIDKSLEIGRASCRERV